MKPFKILLTVIATTLLFASCKKEEHGPYDPSNYIPEVSAEINKKDFNPYTITVAGVGDNNTIGAIARDSNYVLNIIFPENCGEKTYTFPNNNINLTLSLNNTECNSGKLVITKYDSNMVRGEFEFNINKNDTIYEIKNGRFFIVYRIDY